MMWTPRCELVLAEAVHPSSFRGSDTVDNELEVLVRLGGTRVKRETGYMGNKGLSGRERYAIVAVAALVLAALRSEEHTSELQSH